MVTPAPDTPGGPTLMWGGASFAAARRAGRYGLGLLANGGEPACRRHTSPRSREHGHEPGPVLVPDRDTPSVSSLPTMSTSAWHELGEYLLHDARLSRSGIPTTRHPRVSRMPRRRRAACDVDTLTGSTA